MCGEMAPEARRGLSSAEKYPRGVRFGPPRRLSPGADLRSRVTGSAARAMDRRWTRLWTRSLAHLTVQRYQCCASDGLSSCPQPLCPYWVRVSPHARMPLTATAEPAGESASAGQPWSPAGLQLDGYPCSSSAAHGASALPGAAAWCGSIPLAPASSTQEPR